MKEEEKDPLSKRHRKQLIRRRMITQIKPSKKVYKRNKGQEDDTGIS